MNKKTIAIGILAFFLIMSVGAVSAQSIDVKVTGDMPDAVKVSLIRDGNVVDTATLSQANSWKTTFTVDDGNYQLKVSDDSDYSLSVSGNDENGFVVNSKLISGDVLGANEDTQLEEDATGQDNGNAEPTGEVNANDPSSNENDPSEINEPNEDDNATEDDDNATEEDVNETSDEGVVVTDGNNVDTPDKVVKKEKKPVVKKQDKAHKAKLKHTGLPLVVLVIAAFAAIFIPLTRRK